jgi:hypothetical protein
MTDYYDIICILESDPTWGHRTAFPELHDLDAVDLAEAILHVDPDLHIDVCRRASAYGVDVLSLYDEGWHTSETRDELRVAGVNLTTD